MSSPISNPSQAFDLALAHYRSGRFAEARELCRQLLALSPANASTLYLLGLIQRETGLLPEAADYFHQATQANPHESLFHNDLGDVLHTQGRLDEAVAAYRRALHLQPAFAAAHNNLGNALKDQGHLESAVAAYQQALQLAPDLPEVYSNLSSALCDLNRWPEASAAARHALALRPAFPMACNNFGKALMGLHRFEEAIPAFQHALDLEPGFALARTNLGNALKSLGREAEALAAYRDAVAADPQSPLALSNLATGLYELGRVDEAIALDRRAAAAPGTPAAIFSNYLAVLHDNPEISPQKLLEEHDAFDRRYAAPLRASWLPHLQSRDPHRRLRLGFLSRHFSSHPVGFFLIQALANLDRHAFEIVCYADGTVPDAMTARFQAAAHVWTPVGDLSDESLARRIREDRIDILFDLAGHTARNRLLVFARKPAPIQITWLDYVGTTGLRAIDYLLADSRQVPLGTEHFYREKVLRLPDDYICFDPPSPAPPVTPLPALTNGFITFASFNTVPKTNQRCVQLWSRILRQVPDARLILKNRRFDHPEVVQRCRQWFLAESVDPARVTFQGWAARSELLAAYQHVDLALDTLPYNGGLTTCEALWMGAPVVTCPGETFASRHGLAHLTAAGLTETIARDLDEYLQIAVSLANDRDRLSILRGSLRERVAASPLCNGPQFAHHLANLLRQVWQVWCAAEGGGPDAARP